MSTSPVLMPHAVCWAAAPGLVWTMVVANAITFLSYVSLSLVLLLIARRTFRIMAKDWILFVIGFALFIVACGSTHLMDVVTTWIPVFWTDAWATIVTAALSALVAVMLLRRATHISFAINDYAERLASTEKEKDSMLDKLVAARKLEDWSKMSAAIAHEISNPLEAIQNSLYLIHTTRGVSRETIELARQAQEEVGRVIEISRSTLSFHRESANPELVNLSSVADSVRFLLDTIIRQKQIDFRVVGEPDVYVLAFPGETRQIVLNLARNACEAITQPHRAVIIDFAKAEHGIELRVADQGSGIAPELLPKLFEFGRSTKGENGNGLGLWTVRQMMQRSGGHIAVDPTYSEGARFIVWWPEMSAVASSAPSDGTTTPLLRA